MNTWEAFEEQLQDGLAHLHDPGYQPPALLYAVTGCDPRDGAGPLQSAIIHEIENLKPGSSTPRSARSRIVYDVLYHRYVLKLTQEETAKRISLSVRHLSRIQREAVHVLARALWERGGARGPAAGTRSEAAEPQPLEVKAGEDQAPDWRSQTEHELASLRSSAPGAVSEVRDVIDGLMEVLTALAAQHGIRVTVERVQPGLVAAVHPSALDQMLIAGVGRLTPYTTDEQITIYAGLEDGDVKITITSSVGVDQRLTSSDLVRDILTPQNAAVEARIEQDRVFLRLRMPSAQGRITVLVVDDNPDMVHFFRRSTAGTRYRIVHTTHGDGLSEIIESAAPEVIVLDVMLPDIDGWKLLMRLRQDPATRQIPVIVCTVVQERELALSLGAAIYLPKPVRRAQFMQALAQLLPQS